MKDLQKIKNKVTSIWSYTELETGDFSRSGLQKHINEISNIVNDVLGDLEELQNCSLCSYEVCDSCSDGLAEGLNS